MSPRSQNDMFAVLKNHYTEVRITTIDTLADLEALVARNPDLVFLGMKFIPVHPDLGFQDPEKIWVADYLDNHDIAYTGSGPLAHELELNKHMAKQYVMNAGLSTSLFYVAKQDHPLVCDDIKLTFPVFIKPTNRGGGLGIDSNSVAANFQELETKVKSIATNLHSDSLIEEYLPGREFSVTILKFKNSTEFSVIPLELVASADANGMRMLSGSVKSSNEEVILEVTDIAIRSAVCELAINAFIAIGARDYGRIDIRLDEHGIPHFLEANLIPSLIAGYGTFPKACLIGLGLDYEAMVLRIVELGMIRNTNIREDILEPIIPTTLLELV
jgi:D-alanine-D-alanine ligase